jgi:pimeloyl-ACP methyl ester carboxylesterase
MKTTAASDTHVQRPNRGWKFYLRRAGLAILAVTLTLAALGATYETMASRRDARDLKPIGQLVDMGGHRLHLYCTGSSNPADLTVLLESGLSSTTGSWTRIQSQLATTVRVCSYDRGGIGWSDFTTQLRDGKGVAAELDELLRRADINGTLVLVGHSAGGIYARAFQAAYPNRVAGVALLDSSHQDQFIGSEKGEASYKRIKGAYGLLPIAARLGIVRLSPLCNLPSDLSEAVRKDNHATCSTAKSFAAGRAELEGLSEAMNQVRGATLGNLPLVVVTAGSDTQSPGNWLELQSQLATLSTNAAHIVRKNATHPGLLLEPDDASACANAILTMVQAIRQERLEAHQ